MALAQPRRWGKAKSAKREDLEDDDDFASADGDDPTEQQDRYDFLDAVSIASHCSFDSDVSEDEARDTVSELKRFAKPAVINQSMSVMFFVDSSFSMRKKDIAGRQGLRRIDAVIEVLKRFITQQIAAGAAMDLYSLVTFAISGRQVKFHRQRGAEAVSKLTTASFQPDGAVKYGLITATMKELAVPGQACRVIFLSDGCTGCLEGHVLPGFQEIMAQNPHMIIHTIGFGDCDFSILQQLAQIGRGSFSRATMDIDNLVNTFTSLSQTITQTRNHDHVQERMFRSVRFDSATRFGTSKAIAFKTDGARKGLRSTYKLHDGELRKKTEQICVIRLHENPFMQGGMRLVYRCQDEMISRRMAMVAKFSRFNEDDNSWDYIFGFVKNAAQTRAFSKKFHDAYWTAKCKFGYHREPARLVSCNDAWVYTLPETSQDHRQLFIAEPFLHRSEQGFLKWVNNRGEILIPASSSDFSMAVEAFAHFSLDQSGGTLMVSDLQGVLKKGYGNCRRVHLTDPQILSLDQSFGAADLGPTAMQTFRSVHVCSPLCKKLGLSSLSGIPRAPRTRSAVCNVRHRPRLPVIPPPPPPSEPACTQRERGRSRERRTPADCKSRPQECETLLARDLLLTSDQKSPKRLLFVGEYTHLFTVAAAKIVSSQLQLQDLRLEWFSTELRWPCIDSMRTELQQSRDHLTPLGVKMRDQVDATTLSLGSLQLASLAGAIWAMPYPVGQQERSSHREIAIAIQSLITRFVKSVSKYLTPPEVDGVGGKVSVILLANQHLAWKLPVELETSCGKFLREVFWMDLVPFLACGYRPRFGDRRDSRRQAKYHEGDEVVVVQWRRKLGQEDRPAGMTDAGF
eukprot:s3369_g10.t1